jgi:uncharacterized protein YdaU (DUF1376 family)
MSLAEEGAYRRLLDFCWLNGSIPNDERRVARIIGKGATVEIARVCMEMFELDTTDNERLIHDRLEMERQKQEYNSRARKQASEARWSKRGTSAEVRGKQVNTNRDADETPDKSKRNANAMQTECKRNANAMQTECFASSSSSTNNVSGGGRNSYAPAREKPPPKLF